VLEIVPHQFRPVYPAEGIGGEIAVIEFCRRVFWMETEGLKAPRPARRGSFVDAAQLPIRNTGWIVASGIGKETVVGAHSLNFVRRTFYGVIKLGGSLLDTGRRSAC
jgi:hypothetical protein